MSTSSSRRLLTIFGPLALVLAAWSSWPAPRVPQDGALQPVEQPVQESTFRQETIWRFAILQIVEQSGDVVEIPATLIAKLWLTVANNGSLRVEILYENNDFQSVSVRDFTIVRVSTGQAAVEVPIIRDRLSGLAFPELR
ncbi:MAG: hypothetical protein AAF196_15770 [Planctomycetota bacterium]